MFSVYVRLAVFAIMVLSLLLADGLSHFAIAKSEWVEEGQSATAAPSTGQTDVDIASGAITLKIGVAHADSLAPVPLQFSVGEIFDDNLLLKRSKLVWYRIPEWLSGKWQRENESIVRTKDYLTGYVSRQRKSIMSQQVADWGVQRDKKGDIWHTNLSMKGVSNRGSYRSIALVREQVPVKRGTHEIVFKEQFVVLHVMKGTNAIIDSSIIESITRYRPVKRGLLETWMSVKVYNADGTAKTQQENVAFDRLITPYSSVDEYKGMDVRKDFIQFLESERLDELIEKN